MNDIFRQIAKENGTTEKAVKEEMQFAIREAMKSAEPEAIAFWKAVAPDVKEPPVQFQETMPEQTGTSDAPKVPDPIRHTRKPGSSDGKHRKTT